LFLAGFLSEVRGSSPGDGSSWYWVVFIVGWCDGSLLRMMKERLLGDGGKEVSGLVACAGGLMGGHSAGHVVGGLSWVLCRWSSDWGIGVCWLVPRFAGGSA